MGNLELMLIGTCHVPISTLQVPIGTQEWQLALLVLSPVFSFGSIWTLFYAFF